MKKYDCINLLAEAFQYKTYLEIGVRDPELNMDRVNIPSRVGVDPAPWAGKDRLHVMTSDQYFEKLPVGEKFDAILIDGLHMGEQVYRDIENSIKHLNPNGTIFTHDTNPANEWDQRDKPDGGFWNGTVWKGFVKFRLDHQNSDLHFCTVNTDYGIGVISQGQPIPIQFQYDPKWKIGDFNYPWLVANRVKALNLISTDLFKSDYVNMRKKQWMSVTGI